jgi:hypothetical protein
LCCVDVVQGCEATVTFTDSCESVQTEMLARINGQASGAWNDPHNNGTYAAIATPADGTWETSRVTGDLKYTDLINFDFASSESGCKVDACSQSQVTSLGDFSTNFCNIHDLYCSESGCNAFTKLSYEETAGKCTEESPDKCIA